MWKPAQTLARVALIAPILVLALTAVTLNADTIYVCWDGSGDYLTIQAGIFFAQEGDEVVVCDGTYTGLDNRNLDFYGKAITVRSANGPDNCIIDCESAGRGVIFDDGETEASVLDGFTIQNGQANYGGGGIQCYSASPVIRNCRLVGNQAGRDGGGILCDWHSNPVIANCLIESNGAGYDYDGGGVCLKRYSSPTITDCDFINNYVSGSHSWGGGLCVSGDCDPVIVGCLFTANYASSGAGIGCDVYSADVTLRDCTIMQNSGSGLSTSADVTMTDCVITDNYACGVLDYGGGPIQMQNCLIARNVLGGVYSEYGRSTLIDCEVSENGGPNGFGGFFLPSADLTLINCSIVGNTSGLWGGGAILIYYTLCAENHGTPVLTIKNCTISGNVVANGAGGAIYCRGHDEYGPMELTIADSLISGNQAAGVGGGLSCSRSILTLVNCTVAGNTAGAEEGGGAARIANCDDAAINNCVLWGNEPDELYLEYDVNLVVSYSDVQNGWSGEGNIDEDPLFVDPDGPDDDPNTWEDNDYHLGPDSPCIDTGDPDFVPEPDERDIDGHMRVWDGDYDGVWIVDMGSDEFGSIIPGDLDRDGCVGHGDLGILLSSWGSSGGDLDGDGNTNQGDLGILLAHWGEGCP